MKDNKEITVNDINFKKEELLVIEAKEIAKTKEIETRLEPLVKEYGVKDSLELIKSCRDLEYTDQKFKEEYSLNEEIIHKKPMKQETRANNIVDVEFENCFGKGDSQKFFEAANPEYIDWDKKGKKYKVSPIKLAKEILSELDIINSEAWYDTPENKWLFESPTMKIRNLIAIKLTDVYIDGQTRDFWNTRIVKETVDFAYAIDHQTRKAGQLFNDSKPYLIQFDNGIYNIHTGKLQEHNPKEYIFAHHPYSLNMDRELFPIKTIRWFYALTGNFETTRYLIQLCGYIFYRSHAPFQILTILEGGGRNGKSVFLEFFARLVGKEYTTSIAMKNIGNDQNRFSSSGLYNKNINFTTENTNGFIDTDPLKVLTGGDQLTAEFKGKDAFEFTNHSKQIFASNSKPGFRDSSYGFSRRIKVVNFNSEVDSIFINQHHIDEIAEEIPIFARFAMEHFNHALKEGKMAESDDMKESKDEWLYNQNSVHRFVSEECEIVDIELGEKTRVLHETFKNFCSMEGIKELSLTNFLEELKVLGYEKKRFKSTDDGERCMRIPGVILKKDRASSKFSTRRSNELAHLETREFDKIRNHNKKLDEMATHEYNRIVQGRNNNFEGEKNSESK